MKQYTTPVLRMRLCGCKQMLANAVKVETVFRRGSAECRVESQVEGDCVLAALTEAQTGVLCAGPKGHVSAEVTVVGEGVSKSATFYFETFPAVRTEGMGFIGVSDADGDGIVDVVLEGEVFPVKSDYELPAATAEELGGVMVGAGLLVDDGGLLSSEVKASDLQALSDELDSMGSDAEGFMARMREAVSEAEKSAAALTAKLADVEAATSEAGLATQRADAAAAQALAAVESLSDLMGGSY